MSNIKKEFVIIRTDQYEESPKISSIYNLSILNKIKESKGNKQLKEEKKEIILYTIKKMILSTNLYSKWKANTTQYLIIFLHFFFFVSELFSFIKDKNFIIKEKNKIFIFIIKSLILHSMLIPFWILFYNGISNLSDKIQRIMMNLGKYILKYDSINNKYYNFELLNDLSLKVKTKEKYEINIENEENIFSYIIAVNADYFEVDDILYKSLIPNSDFAIIINIYTFINHELNTRFEFFLKKLVIPSFITIVSFYYLSRDTPYHSIKCLFIILILLILVFILEGNYRDIYLKKFENYIDNYNMNYYTNGKFIFKYKTLLIIFTLNSMGKLLSLDKLKNKIQKIINN